MQLKVFIRVQLVRRWIFFVQAALSRAIRQNLSRIHPSVATRRMCLCSDIELCHPLDGAGCSMSPQTFRLNDVTAPTKRCRHGCDNETLVMRSTKQVLQSRSMLPVANVDVRFCRTNGNSSWLGLRSKLMFSMRLAVHSPRVLEADVRQRLAGKVKQWQHQCMWGLHAIAWIV